MAETLLINGQWVASSDGGTQDVTNPANGSVIRTISKGTAADVQAALEAATAAFPVWAGLSARERAAIMHRAMDIFRANLDEANRLLTQEHGKPLNDSNKENSYSADVIDFYAEEGRRLDGTHFAGDIGPTHSFVLRQPIGVVGAITPWNFPVDLLAWKLGPGLAAGCTFVIKPPSEAPLAATLFVKSFVEAGIPAGVLNIVTGPGRSVGAEIVTNPLSRKVAFTGSTATGLWIAQQAAQQLKPVTLELGGSAPFVVADDADLDMAVPEALRRTFSHTGQICISVNRIFVHRARYDEFTQRFADAASKLRVTADGLAEPDADMGPMINASAIETVVGHVEDALERGAAVLTGGQAPSGTQYAHGYFYLPTVLTNVNRDMRVMREETFGPLAPIAAFDTLEEGVEMANDTPYGLAAYVYTNDLDKAFYAAKHLRAGGVGINVNDITDIRAPFGGMKQSGMGRELGQPGLDAYMEYKHVRYRYRDPR
ncbi:MAG TPA: NAD-dependent succinate-semialdehyde dehydrogenase [Aggregatilinea sp.]|uniref:aldehyde dehydrogenase family protein n=1 Tax=Aggregatilinea sp. TaxID=2806333 RepID=UPI002CFE4F19|nr:NAD-dependent succinate-semialdehyde dehydrogenase [Aggregatilinea sp.]HML20525.1 NAD-dependent succinate-semialdehyde dehydrogenase [Aggregatilinea sp.]